MTLQNLIDVLPADICFSVYQRHTENEIFHSDVSKEFFKTDEIVVNYDDISECKVSGVSFEKMRGSDDFQIVVIFIEYPGYV